MALDPDRLLKPVKKLRKLIDRVEAESGPETVHDLRTTTRRFEAMFEALSLDQHGIPKTMLKDLGRIRKRAGKVRDMDVLTGFASTVRPQGAEECQVELLEYLGAQRQKHAAKLSAEARDLHGPLRRDLKRAGSVLAKLLREDGDSDKGNTVSLEATANAVKLAVQLGTPPRLGRDNLHPYRLKIKELQNVLRMAAGSPRPRFVDDLGEVKDAIGEWHDWEELALIAEKQLDRRSKGGLQPELKRIARQKYEHALDRAQQLRDKYLQDAHPAGKRASAAAPKIPRPPVWEATSLLAA
jgi:CHAD domain-containing protein